MEKTIKAIIVSTLLITLIFQVTNVSLAGDENDPEITDEEDDLFGPWAKPEDIKNYKYLDIVSAWFEEKADEPDYLFLSIKVKNFKFELLRAIYAMHWEYNGVEYATGVHTHTSGSYQVFIAGISRTEYFTIAGSFDEENNIISFKVPKMLVGNPGKGDVLTQTDAWNALRKRIEVLTLLSGDGELIKDWAGYGRDYAVQYDSLGAPYMHRLFGEVVVRANTESYCNFQAEDPQDEEVFYYIDWGDGTIDEWIGPYESNEPINLKHIFTEHGSSTVRAKAKDSNGFESEWAELVVSVIKPKSIVQNRLDNFLLKFPLIRQFFRMISNKLPFI